MAEGGSQIIPCQTAPRPIPGTISPSKAHLHKSEEHRGRWESKLRYHHPVLAAPGAVPAQPSAPDQAGPGGEVARQQRWSAKKVSEGQLWV